MTDQKDDSLILRMAGKILAPIATRNPDLAGVAGAARTILNEVDSTIAQQDRAAHLNKMRNEIAEIAAVIFAEQLSASNSAELSSNPEDTKNAVKAGVDLALQVLTVM
jgi:hypothetical protein